MTTKKRISQHKDESAIEYLRRLVSNIDYEDESILQHLPSVEAVIDYFDLWKQYDTEYWGGILDEIADGKSPDNAMKFVAKHTLPWGEDIVQAVERAIINHPVSE